MDVFKNKNRLTYGFGRSIMLLNIITCSCNFRCACLVLRFAMIIVGAMSKVSFCDPLSSVQESWCPGWQLYVALTWVNIFKTLFTSIKIHLKKRDCFSAPLISY